MASVVPSIRIIKNFSYRGALRPFSNRYYMTGPPPADSAHWTTLADAITNAEKAALTTNVAIIGAVGYEAGSEVPVFTKTYALATTLAVAAQLNAGEAAALVRYSTTARSTKNHPIYAYNYYHSVMGTSTALPDTLLAAQKTVLQTYANLWISGFSDGTTLHVRSTPAGHTCNGAFIEPFITHRDFPK